MSGIFLYDESLDSDDQDYELNLDDTDQSSSFDDCLHSTMSCGLVHSSSSGFPESWLLRSESVESFDCFPTFIASDDFHSEQEFDLNTLENLKSQFNSCYTCGVSWSDGHVSLDCKECGGYPLTRPCLSCDGKCDSQWERDSSKSHDTRRAHWEGECSLESQQTPTFLNEDLLIQGVEQLSTSS